MSAQDIWHEYVTAKEEIRIAAYRLCEHGSSRSLILTLHLETALMNIIIDIQIFIVPLIVANILIQERHY